MKITDILIFDIKDKFGKIHTLKYQLHDSPLKLKFLDLFKKNKARANGNVDSYFNNATTDKLPELLDELKAVVININQQCDFMQLPVYDKVGQKELNHLHELFEEWGAVELNLQDIALAKQFYRLNELIHGCEDCSKPDADLIMGSVVDVKPSIESGDAGIDLKITDRDRLMMTSQYHWGQLLLGYNTLGKDYLAAARDNDVRLIQSDQVKPQVRWANEVWLNFNQDSPFPNTLMLSNWLDEIDRDTYKKIPLDNLQSMSLGRLLLGDLMIDDSHLELDPNWNNWITYLHHSKERWNREVFSTFREVVDVRTGVWPPKEIRDFFEEHENKQWQPDLDPPEDFDLWKSDWPWAPVFIDLNENRVRDELERIDRYFVPHRDKDGAGGYGHQGWSGLTLHGIGSDKTQNYDQYGYKTQEEANYHWTSICKQCPYIVDTIKSLPFSKFDRVRIMKLLPGGYIMPHNDGDGRIFGPLNIPLTQSEGCTFVFEDKGIVPFKVGNGFMLDLGNNHCVVNNSEHVRYHVIVHGTPTEGIAPLIRKSLRQL